jgi:hypothetical protein
VVTAPINTETIKIRIIELVPIFEHFEGLIVKTIGDAFLVTFESPTDAVMCGLAVQEALRQYNIVLAGNKKLEVRVAINSGEVETSEGDVLGEPVNIATLLEELTEPGEVYFTEAVYLSMNRREAPSSEIGERTFKGIPYPIKVYKAIQESGSDFALRLTNSISVRQGAAVVRGLHTKKPTKSLQKTALFLGASVIFLILFFIFMPTKSEKIVNQAADLLNRKNYLAAFELASNRLSADPGNEKLIDIATNAARIQSDNILLKEGPAQALAWLKKELLNKNYLNSLRELLPPLDTKVVVEQLKGSNDSDQEIEKKLFVERQKRGRPGN